MMIIVAKTQELGQEMYCAVVVIVNVCISICIFIWFLGVIYIETGLLSS